MHDQVNKARAAMAATPATDRAKAGPQVAYSTDLGEMLIGKIEDALGHKRLTSLKGKVNLRRWIPIEAESSYVEGSLGRFPNAQRGGNKQ